MDAETHPRRHRDVRPTGVIRIAAVVVSVLCATPAGAQTPSASAPGPCASDTTYHPFDFWVGSWSVRDSTGRLLGSDVVSPIVGGCAFVELWRDADGSEGQSLFYYATDQRRWKQVWVTPEASSVGGFKEKRLVARFPNGGVRFQGELVGPRTIVFDRTTLTPVTGGRVHQVIEISRDGGTTWLVTFDAVYVPAPATGKEKP